MVPFVFVYSPAMLIVTQGFTWTASTVTVVGCAIGIVLIGTALNPARKYRAYGMHTM